MRKLLIFSIMISVLLGSAAFASQTRVMTMGNANNIVKDRANIWMYPSTVNYYPKLFAAEFDYDDFFTAGAHFGFNETNPWVMGFYFSEDNYYHSIWDDEGNNYTNADHRLSFFYGRNLSEMPFGFNFNYWKEGFKNEDFDTQEANQVEYALTRFEFALGLSPMEGKLDLSIGINFTSFTDKDWNGTVLNDYAKGSGNMEFGIAGRYWFDPRGNYTGILHGMFGYEKQGLEYYGGDQTLDNTYKYSGMMFELGYGFNYEAAEDVLVIADFGFEYGTWSEKDEPATGTTDEEKWSDIYFPKWKLGIDAKVFKWMDFRAGVTNEWHSETYEFEENDWKRKWNEADTDTYLGLGMHWGNFMIDVALNEEFVSYGPYFLSGNSTSDMFWQTSITYWLD